MPTEHLKRGQCSGGTECHTQRPHAVSGYWVPCAEGRSCGRSLEPRRLLTLAFQVQASFQTLEAGGGKGQELTCTAVPRLLFTLSLTFPHPRKAVSARWPVALLPRLPVRDAPSSRHDCFTSSWLTTSPLSSDLWLFTSLFPLVYPSFGMKANSGKTCHISCHLPPSVIKISASPSVTADGLPSPQARRSFLPQTLPVCAFCNCLLEQGGQTHLHWGPHQPCSCLQRAKCNFRTV